MFHMRSWKLVKTVLVGLLLLLAIQPISAQEATPFGETAVTLAPAAAVDQMAAPPPNTPFNWQGVVPGLGGFQHPDLSGALGDWGPNAQFLVGSFVPDKAASDPVEGGVTPRPPMEPPLPPDALRPGLPPGAYVTPAGILAMSAEAVERQGRQPLAMTEPMASGGPDEFGYVWSDAVPLNWINATDGTDTGMSGSSGGQRVGPIPLPFSFKYYENVYDSVYIAASGYIAFSDEGEWPWQGAIPSLERPNNMVAPYWAPFNLAASGPAGRVYYKSGGTTPNRYFVVEWHQVTGGDDDFTFEVILFENGDILFQYLGMVYRNNDWWCGSIGIEDSKGQDGLAIMSFCERAPGYRAVKITRPAPTARVSIYPSAQGRHVYAGELVAFQIPIRNTGDLGSDIYNLVPISNWPAQLLRADGVTPLTDTNGDGQVDTGPVSQGNKATVVVKVQTPTTNIVGINNTVRLEVRSARNSSKQKTVLLQTAVPTAFAQVYRDDADRAMSLYLAQPAGQAVRKATADGYQGGTLAVAETPGGNFVYVWRKGRWVSNVWVDELEYAVLDRFGNVVKPPARLADLSGATVSTYDGSPAVAATPNGRVGVFWSRYLWNDATSQFNYNLYFAVLDDEGNVAVAPTNITNNDIWGRWSDLNVPRFYAPRIAAVGSNRFVMAWQRSEPVSGGWIEDIWYTVRNASGREIRGLTKLTDDLPQDMRHQEPALATLANDRVFLSWFRGAPGNDEILYVVLNSDGSIYRSVNVLSDNAVVDWRNFDAVQFSNGRILAAWEAWGCFPGEWAPRLRLAVLDESFNRVAGPTCLNNTALTNGDSQASLTADAQGRAVVTWMATDRRYQGSLYYALVDGDGAVITPPMIFRASQATSPYIETSFEGYGNTSYRWTPPAGVDAFIRAASPVSGTVGGYVAIPVTYGNVGGQAAGNVQLVATLPTGLTYDYDTSGVTPTVTGNQVRWSLPNLSVLARPEFVLYLRVAGDVPLGARLAVSLSLTTAGPETNPADNNANAEIVAGPAPGGPDGYGYIWDDAAPFRWVDATLGENTGITGDDRAGPVDIGFPFRFYDQTWTQVYVSTNGILVFGQDSHGCCGRVPMPLPGSPNNVIAPYWTDLTVGPPYNNGAIYVRRGGQAPRRYLAVAWHNVTLCCGTSSTDYKTFEVLLHENGDITFMHHTLQGWSGTPSVGIEDSTGYDGLQYTGTPTPGKAIRFFRPGPAARVRVTPPYQGQFARLGGTSTFTVPIQNTGELGSDTYDLTVTSTWPVTLYAADGVTPLADTDGDGKADTGPVAQGATTSVIVKVQTPSGAQVGNHNAATVTVGSSRDVGKGGRTTLQTAIPTTFAQIYRNVSDGTLGLQLARPEGQAVRTVHRKSGTFEPSAVVELRGGGFIAVWTPRRCLDQACRLATYEIYYSVVSARGEVVKASTKLSDHTGASVSTYDLEPAVAVLPNGTIGLVWYRYLYNPDTFQRNYNIYFAALDTAGHVLIPARNLTNNNTWGTWSDLNVPSFYYPRIAATEDNRFVLAWTREHRESSGWVTDVWYTVLDANGAVVKPETRLTNDSPGSDDSFYAPALAALTGRRALLAFQRGGNHSDIFAVVVNSSGTVVMPRANLSRDSADRWDWGPDAVQLSDGRVVVAWTSEDYPSMQIRFAVVDSSLNVLAGPTLLDNPVALTGDMRPSVTSDQSGRAVITWMDYHPSYRRHLYYALVDSTGAVLTPPTLFRTGEGPDPYLDTSYSGQGNTTWSWTPPAGVDAVLSLGVSPVWGPAGGEATLDVRYTNYGLTTGTDTTLVATLDSALGYVGDTSGVTPIVSGNTLTWHLPDLAFLGDQQFDLRLSLPANSRGARYPVQITLTTAGPEAEPGDNTVSTQVGIPWQVHLPIVMSLSRP